MDAFFEKDPVYENQPEETVGQPMAEPTEEPVELPAEEAVKEPVPEEKPAAAEPNPQPQGYVPYGYTQPSPQNYQPQNYPPQGYAQPGYPPQNYPPQGYPQPGYQPQGYPQQGYSQSGYGRPAYTQPTYGGQNVPPYGTYPQPVRRTRKKRSNAWKGVIAIFSIMCLCVSIFAGIYLASDLRDRSAAGEKTIEFLFPSREKANDDPGLITDLQNSEYASIADIAEDVGRSVVTIITTVKTEDPTGIFGDAYSGEALGSGVIIGEQEDELYIATNFHVIDGASDVSVLMGENNTHASKAYYKGSDSQSDLAVIYVKKSEVEPDVLKDIKIATLGESDALKVGDLAIAIGSPIDKSYSNTVTAGIISGLERSVTFVNETTGISNTLILLQTDTAINPGNSGGALVNGRGEVIGINDAKIVSSDVEGMGFAIPISSAKPVLESLITRGKVIRPYLGIVGNAIDPSSEFAVQYGLLSGIYVQQVMEGLSASKAGMLADDVIITFKGVNVEKFSDLTETLAACEIGETVEVVVVRGYMEGAAETVTLTLTIEEKPGDYD